MIEDLKEEGEKITVQLFKTKADAKEECSHIKRVIIGSKCIPIKIRFDDSDGPQFGMRGFGFKARHGKTYYIIAETKKEAKSWKLHSKIL